MVARLGVHRNLVLRQQLRAWAIQMMDYNSVGQLTCLSPITWEDGWPYYGLPGNLKRTPRIWAKPNTGHHAPPSAPYERSDDFSGSALKPLWQWHHLPAADLWWARNTLTQRAIGPQSSPTTELDTSGMQAGDVAGCDFLTEQAAFSYSTDGATFHGLGGAFAMIFQLKTFQGVRYALFHYNSGGVPGGYADFAQFTVEQPYPRGLRQPIPFGKTITLATIGAGAVLAIRDGMLSAVPAGGPLAQTAAARFHMIDCGLGRIALQSAAGFVSVLAPGGSAQVVIRAGQPTDAETFQWTETPYGDLILLSLVTRRHLRVDPRNRIVAADQPGPLPDRSDGACFRWTASAEYRSQKSEVRS